MALHILQPLDMVINQETISSNISAFVLTPPVVVVEEQKIQVHTSETVYFPGIAAKNFGNIMEVLDSNSALEKILDKNMGAYVRTIKSKYTRIIYLSSISAFSLGVFMMLLILVMWSHR